MPKNEVAMRAVPFPREIGDQMEEPDYEAEAAAHCLHRAQEIRNNAELMERVKFYLANRKAKSEREERLAKEII